MRFVVPPGLELVRYSSTPMVEVRFDRKMIWFPFGDQIGLASTRRSDVIRADVPRGRSRIQTSGACDCGSTPRIRETSLIGREIEIDIVGLGRHEVSGIRPERSTHRSSLWLERRSRVRQHACRRYGEGAIGRARATDAAHHGLGVPPSSRRVDIERLRHQRRAVEEEQMARPVVGQSNRNRSAAADPPHSAERAEVDAPPIEVGMSHLKQEALAIWQETPAIGPSRMAAQRQGRSRHRPSLPIDSTRPNEPSRTESCHRRSTHRRVNRPVLGQSSGATRRSRHRCT